MMKPVTVNGVRLSDEAISELLFLQQGVETEEDLSVGEPNTGINDRVGKIDEVTRFLIALDAPGEAQAVLSLLKDLMYIRDTFNKLRLPDGNSGPRN